MKTRLASSLPAIEFLEARIAPAAVATIALANLDGAHGFKLSGVADGDFAGSSVSAAGDVNGDGFDDLIIGAFSADEDGVNRGASYVVFGKAGGFAASIALSALDGTTGFKLSGVGNIDRAGYSVSAAGDVNGDGFDDLIIGAPLAQEGGFDRGASYVVFGKAGGFAASVALSGLDGTDGFKLSGVADGDRAGFSVSAAGDVNGDGFDDIIIGADNASEGGNVRGASYVVFGKATGFAASIALSGLDGTNGFKLSGTADYDRSGRSVSAAGDVNGDGFGDLIIGAFGANEGGNDRGASYVVFGKAGGFAASVALSGLDGTNGFKVSGVADGDNSGYSVSAAGDVNGDGFDDLIIGAFHADEGGNNRGASYVVFGKATGFAASAALSTLVGSNGFKLSGVADGDTSGFSVSTAGDVNGDGFDDLIIGAHVADEGGDDRGASYVVFGFGTAHVNVAANGKSARFTDWDGDQVTIKTTRGTLDPAQFDLFSPSPDTHGAHLIYADFTDPGFAKANITITARRGPGGGDGLVNIGTLDAHGVTLGKVSVNGDLLKFDAAGAAGLAVYSLGQFAEADIHGAPLTSTIEGRLGALSVKTDASYVTVAAQTFGAIKALSLDHVSIFASGVLAPAKAANALAIKSLTVAGTVRDSHILAGYDASGAAVNADVAIGKVLVKGRWIASDLVAGVAAGDDGKFATEDDALIPGGNAIVAKIASITIAGSALGTLDDVRDGFGFAAEQIGAFRIGKAKLPLQKGARNDTDVLSVSITGDVRAHEVA